MKRIVIEDLPEYVGEEVKIAGWVSVRRDQGKLVFFVIRDRSGKVQAVVLPDTPELVALAQTIKLETAIALSGVVKERPNKNADPENRLEFVELAVTDISILGTPSEELVIDVSQSEMGLQLDTL